MGSWFDNNIQKTHGPRISKEMAEALGVFRFCDTGLKRKPDGSLQVLFNAPHRKMSRKIKSVGIFKWKKLMGRLYLYIKAAKK